MSEPLARMTGYQGFKEREESFSCPHAMGSSKAG